MMMRLAGLLRGLLRCWLTTQGYFLPQSSLLAVSERQLATAGYPSLFSLWVYVRKMKKDGHV